jgi:hypothetical protein
LNCARCGGFLYRAEDELGIVTEACLICGRSTAPAPVFDREAVLADLEREKRSRGVQISMWNKYGMRE